MFVFMSHLTVSESDRDVLEAHFRDRSRLVDAFPGFLYLQVLAPQAGTGTLTFLTAWQTREAMAAYMTSEAHAVSRGRNPAAVMARAAVRHEAFEVLLDSRSGD
jgi:heme-degrading monooxygenase HmoA